LKSLKEKTVRGYIQAASAALTLITGRVCSVNDPRATAASKTSMHPILNDILRRRKAWEQPAPKKLMITLPMLKAMYARTITATTYYKEYAFIGRMAALWDWQCVTLFTGSRISEYGQNKGTTKEPWDKIPQTVDAGEWAGMPIAFVESDIIFYSESQHVVPHIKCDDPATHHQIRSVHLRFRYDKSKENFVIKSYRRQKASPIICPVQALINICRRAHMLQIPDSEPIAQFRDFEKKNHAFRRCLLSKDVVHSLRTACVAAYPDPSHYCRINCKRLVTHSNRVTAAVCLLIGGCTLDEIALRLRWKRDSVPTYLREHVAFIDRTMQGAIAGAFATA
jgi:hypothetical protein